MPDPVTEIFGKAVPVEIDDVDTDQIIPAEFLKVTAKEGLGKYLFYRWRHDENGKHVSGFPLDMDEFRDAKVLIAGRNFGIGSSRENAVWAILDAGIRCVIATSFGDIFYNNSSKNGLVCVKLEEETEKRLREGAKSGTMNLKVSLDRQEITFAGGKIPFDIEPHIKELLQSGSDQIRLTLSTYESEIEEHERNMQGFLRPKARTMILE